MTGFVGIALPPFGAYILEEHINNERLRKHELQHLKQANDMGGVKFYLIYLWYSVRYGYLNNPLEVDARNAESLPT